LSVFVEIKAQCIPDSFYRTDWRINLGNPSQNRFNWVKIQPQVVAYILGKTGIDSVPLPYYCLKPPGSGSCDNENLYYFHDLEKTKQDIRPEEGWELIIADFGSPIVRIENPRFILYNKYTIILPESWTRGLVKKSLNLTKRYDQTNPTQIHA